MVTEMQARNWTILGLEEGPSQTLLGQGRLNLHGGAGIIFSYAKADKNGKILFAPYVSPGLWEEYDDKIILVIKYLYFYLFIILYEVPLSSSEEKKAERQSWRVTWGPRNHLSRHDK